MKPTISNRAFGTNTSKYPELWNGLVGAWIPTFGDGKSKLYNFARRRGSATLAGTTTRIPTVDGYGLSLVTTSTSSDNMATLGTGSEFATTSGQPWSIMIKYNMTNTNSYARLLGSTPQFARVGVLHYYNGTTWVSAGGTFELNTFITWGFVYEGTTFRVYKNGRLMYSATEATFNLSGTHILGGSSFAEPGKGTCSGVYIYHRVLNNAEVAQFSRNILSPFIRGNDNLIPVEVYIDPVTGTVVTADLIASFESKLSLAADKILNLENTITATAVSKDSIFNLESLIGIRKDSAGALENLTGARTSLTFIAENLTALRGDKQATLESLAALAKQNGLNFESKLSLAKDSVFNLESLTRLATDKQANLENRFSLTTDKIGILESVISTRSSHQLLVESLAGIGSSSIFTAEFLSSVLKGSELSLENKKSLLLQFTGCYESLLAFGLSVDFATEFLCRIQADGAIPISWNGGDLADNIQHFFVVDSLNRTFVVDMINRTFTVLRG